MIFFFLNAKYNSPDKPLIKYEDIVKYTHFPCVKKHGKRFYLGIDAVNDNKN